MVFYGMELAQFSVSCFFFHFNCKSGMRQAEISLNANYMTVLPFVVGFLVLPFTLLFFVNDDWTRVYIILRADKDF